MFQMCSCLVADYTSETKDTCEHQPQSHSVYVCGHSVGKTLVSHSQSLFYGRHRMLPGEGKKPFSFSHPAAVWFAQREMTVLFVLRGTAATHQVEATVERALRAPLELRPRSGGLRGGPLIASSTANWFSARSEPECQRVKEEFPVSTSIIQWLPVCVHMYEHAKPIPPTQSSVLFYHTVRTQILVLVKYAVSGKSVVNVPLTHSHWSNQYKRHNWFVLYVINIIEKIFSFCLPQKSPWVIPKTK